MSKQKANANVEASGGVFRSFAEPNVRIYMGGVAISNVGTWAQVTAAVLLVRELGGGGLELGLVAACQFLPLLLFGLYAGAVADRIDRHKATIRLQALMGVQALALGVLTLADAVTIPIIYAMTLLLGMLSAFDQPARRTLSTELVGPEMLANILALGTSMLIGGRIFGPAIAAVMTDAVGAGWVFVANGVTYLAYLAAMFAMDTSRFRRIESAPRSPTPVRDGLQAVWAEPVLRVTLVVLAVISTFAYNHLVYIPLLVDELLNRDEAFFGWFLSMLSLGNVVGALLVARLVVIRQELVYGSALAMGACLCALSFSGSTALSFGIVAVLGATMTLFVNGTNMIFQQRTSPQLRSRILALTAVIFLGSTPVGGPVTGALGDAFGARWAVLYGGIVAIGAFVYGIASLGRLGRDVVAETPVGAPSAASSGVAENRTE